MERYRQIIYFKDYFFDFFEQQTEKLKQNENESKRSKK